MISFFSCCQLIKQLSKNFTHIHKFCKLNKLSHISHILLFKPKLSRKLTITTKKYKFYKTDNLLNTQRANIIYSAGSHSEQFCR